MVSIAPPGGAWSRVVNGLSDPNAATTALMSDGATVYVATGSNGVFAAPMGAGYAWTAFSGSTGTALPSLEVHALRMDGQTLFAATAGGLATLGAPSSGPPSSSSPSGGSSSGGGGALDARLLLGLLLATVLMARRPRR
jgi:hypothetical protein